MRTFLAIVLTVFGTLVMAAGWTYEGNQQSTRVSLLIGGEASTTGRLLPLQGFVEFGGRMMKVRSGACNLYQDGDDVAVLCGRDAPLPMRNVVYVRVQVPGNASTAVSMRCVRACGKNVPTQLVLDSENER